MKPSEAVNSPITNIPSDDISKNTTKATIAMEAATSTNTTSTMKIESISVQNSATSLDITNDNNSSGIEEEKKQDQFDSIIGPSSSSSTKIDTTVSMNRQDSLTSEGNQHPSAGNVCSPVISIETYINETDKSRERLRKLRQRRLERGEELTPTAATKEGDGNESEANDEISTPKATAGGSDAAEAGAETQIVTPKLVMIGNEAAYADTQITAHEVAIVGGEGTEAEANTQSTTPEATKKGSDATESGVTTESDGIRAEDEISTPKSVTIETDEIKDDTEVETEIEPTANLNTDVIEQYRPQEKEKSFNDGGQNVSNANDDCNQSNLEPEIKKEQKDIGEKKQEDNKLKSEEIETENGINTVHDNNEENIKSMKEEGKNTLHEMQEDNITDNDGNVQVTKTDVSVSSDNVRESSYNTRETQEDDNSIKVHEPVAMKPMAILPPIRQSEVGVHTETIPIAIERQGVFHVNNSAPSTAFERYDASAINRQIPIPINAQTNNSSINTSSLDQVLLTPHGSTVMAHTPSISHVPSREQLAIPQPMYVPVTRNSVAHELQFSAPVPQQPARRSMSLRLEEEIKVHLPVAEGSATKKKKSLLSRISRRRAKSHNIGDDNEDVVQSIQTNYPAIKRIDRGTVSVSWYAGTTSTELQNHVKNCVERKLSLGSKKLLRNFRVIDESVQPSEGEFIYLNYLYQDDVVFQSFHRNSLLNLLHHRNCSLFVHSKWV